MDEQSKNEFEGGYTKMTKIEGKETPKKTKELVLAQLELLRTKSLAENITISELILLSLAMEKLAGVLTSKNYI